MLLVIDILSKISIVSIYCYVIPIEVDAREVDARRTISNWTPHSLNREND